MVVELNQLNSRNKIFSPKPIFKIISLKIPLEPIESTFLRFLDSVRYS